MMSNILLIQPKGPERSRLEEALCGLPRGGEPPRVVTAADSHEALVRVGTQPFDLVVADLVLPKPGLSGAEALMRIGEIHPTARTILFTEHTYARDLLEGLADVFLARGPDSGAFRAELAENAGRLLNGSAHGFVPASEKTTVAGRLGEGDTRGGRNGPRLIADKYLLTKELGRGGMGVVYQAEDTFIGRPVAIKLLHVEVSRDRENLTRRMRREVMIAGRLHHPNIVTIFDAGFDGDDMYFVMELIDGQTLRQVLCTGATMSREEAVDILVQTLDAVAYAHRQQVVHRDLKPENILLTPEGNVKIVDFGIAKIVSLASSSGAHQPAAGTTARGAVLGTKGYMAPEQLVGAEVDHRADLYALGVVLFEMLQGRPLPGPASTLARGASKRDKTGWPTVPGQTQLTRIIRRAMAFSVDDRYADGEVFADALRSLVTPSWKRFFLWR